MKAMLQFLNSSARTRVVLAGLLWLGLSPVALKAHEDAATVTVQLKWKHAFQFAGYYAAIDQGYYADAGLEVELLELDGSDSTTDSLLDGKADYAVTGADLLLYRARGEPVVALGAIYQHSPYGFLVLADSGIERIEDFRGKRVMLNTGQQDADLQAAMDQAGLSPSDYTRLPTSFDVMSLVRGETDVFNAYTTDQLFTLQEAGYAGRYILPQHYDVEFYGDILATTEHEINQHPARVEAFRQASLAGWEYALNNPDAMIDLILAEYNTQGLSRAHLEYEARISREMIQPLLITLGHMNPARLEHMRQTFVDLGVLPPSSSIDGLQFRYEANPYLQWFADHLVTVIGAIVVFILVSLGLVMLQMRRVINNKTSQLVLKQNDLHDQHAKLQNLLDSINGLSWEVDLMRNRFSYVSPNITRLLGYQPEDWRDLESWLALVVDEDQEHVKEHAIGETSRGRDHAYEFRLRKRNGDIIWMMNVVRVILDNDNRPMKLAGFSVNITERKLAEEAMLVSEDRYRTIFEGAPEGVLLIDQYNSIIKANDRICSLLDCSDSDLLGRNIRQLVHTGDDDSLFETSPAESYRREAEARLLHRKGHEIPALVSITSLSTRFNSVAARVVFITDLSEQKTAEKTLRRAQKMDAIGQLTGGIAHDFNNILGIIQGNLDMLEQDGGDPARNQGRIASLKRVTDRATKLTQQLLGFSRTHADHSSVTCLNTVICDMRELTTRSVTPEVDIRYDLADDLWYCMIDAGDFQDALLNLVINAHDAMDTGGAIDISTCNVHFEQPRDGRFGTLLAGNYVRLCVSDSGKGIPAELIDNIFEPFFTTKDYGKGTGLGLSMVFGFVQRCAGHIDVTSTVGAGTTICMYLPMTSQQPEPEQPQLTDGQDGTSDGRETILVVDDEEALLELARQRLLAQGYEVLTARSGQEALARLRDNPRIALLFTDVVMPGGMNGFELAEQAYQIRPDLKILHTSGYNDEDQARKYNALFKPNMIGKPYSQQQMIQRIRRVLDSDPT